MSIDPNSTYYDAGGIEAMDVIKAKMSTDKYQGYLLGNILKYAQRLEFKTIQSRLRDAEKITTYAMLLQKSIGEQEK